MPNEAFGNTLCVVLSERPYFMMEAKKCLASATKEAPPEPLPPLTEKVERNIQKKLTKRIDSRAPGSSLAY